MRLEQVLKERSGNHCELSGAENNLVVYPVSPAPEDDADRHVYITEKCVRQIEGKEATEPHFWVFLKESVWSEVPAVKVLSYRMLNRLRSEGWALEALDSAYLDDELLEWANEEDKTTAEDVHRDSNGTVLQNGDTVILIKSLDVKGSSVNARMGTAVRNIKLVRDNSDQIEGKIDGQLIVILTKYVRKSS